MIKVSIADVLKPDDLVRRLLAHGYEPEFQVATPGQFARRGGIIDIVATGRQHPVRLEFSGNTITGMYTICDQQKITQKNELVILPHLPDLPLERIHFISTLTPGDFVVHIDHGIGQFSGLVTKTVAGHERDYLELTYAQDDKLFVPVEMADRVDRYLGRMAPLLHRLSGSTWYQTMATIKDDAKRFAESLLHSQAQRQLAKTTPLPPQPTERAFATAFPYSETRDQKRAIQETLADLAKNVPMDRLIAGDVGFGKTEVAFRAAFRAISNGQQVLLLCPTTVLAQQHVDTATARFAPFGVTVAGLSRMTKTSDEDRLLLAWHKGTIDLLIGTHRLLSSDIDLKNTGLIIIDEEQKFGVKQKERCQQIRHDVHTLLLSATPIPRTLHIAVSGLKTMSVIQTPPLKRHAITTTVEPYDEQLVIAACQRELARGGQIYYLWNDVATIGVAAKTLATLLHQAKMPNVKIGILHGQLAENEISETMHAFDTGVIDILICSTIIENGLDLPNVNTLIVPDAVRFGLAQLYQIRGRVGRGERQAHAWFMFARTKLSPLARRRLETIKTMNHAGAGLEVALRDMELRGVGTILSKKQHGHVKAIGLNLYLKLLAEAVFELKTGIARPPTTDPLVELPFSAGIPASVIADPTKRTRRYVQLASIDSLEVLERERRDLITATSPARLHNFFFTLRVKILARQAGLVEVRVAQRHTTPDLVMTLTSARPWLIGQIEKLLAADEEWLFHANSVKRVLAETERKQWPAVLVEGLQLLQQKNTATLQ